MKTVFFILLVTTSLAFSLRGQPFIDLSGAWFYRLDDNERGEKEKWFAGNFTGNTIQLPAALRDQNIGYNLTLKTQWTGGIYDSSWFFNPEMAKYRKTDSLMFPFWLTPVKRYVGKAWYQKSVLISNDLNEKDLLLILERPHWQTKVWWDSVQIGSDNSLSTPHRMIIPAMKAKKGLHRLTICVDNAIRDIDPGINSHSITDHTQGNWNGLVGKLTLQAINPVRIVKVWLQPVLSEKKVKVRFLIPKLQKNSQFELVMKAKSVDGKQVFHEKAVSLVEQKEIIETDYPMGDNFQTWDEFTPTIYQLEITLKNKNHLLQQVTKTFGMREFNVNGLRFTINGTPVFLRGTTECCVFPLTGYPPTEEAAWDRIFKICKSYGLNHMRFHSYCPPEAAFGAADKAGIYLQVEGPSWAKYSVTLGDGKPIDKYLMEETQRIIDEYGNHPSFVMMAYGNEPSGHYVEYLENWVEHFRNYDPQRVFTGASTGRSWSIIENSDYIVRSPPRGLEWKNRQPESLFDYGDKTENQQRPYVSFEMGQWCAFPNFKEIDKYSGSLKARNFELFREDFSDKHKTGRAQQFLMASGKLQASCYKQEIEATLRTPNLAGFQLLGLNDFSGQGTALVGVLDAFWDTKGYISPDEFRSFCNQVVPLVRLPKYTFYTSETLAATVELANFSGKEITATPCQWTLHNHKNTKIASGILQNANSIIPVGNGNELGKIIFPLSTIKKAQKLVLEVTAGPYKNSWDIWVYPDISENVKSEKVYVSREADSLTLKQLNEGRAVLLITSGKVENGKDVVQHYTPVFWNTSWFRMRPPHTTGLLIDDKHAVFNDFPTDYFSDVQWWELVNNQQVMNLENFPSNFTPIVQPIDTWFLNRRLAMLFEAKVGNGRLMVCSIDSSSNEHGPAMVQFYRSMLTYMNSDAFQPNTALTWETITELFKKKERKTWQSYVNSNP